jgi:DNA-binding winged helix-turn-helix (wHTH) protein
LLYSFDDYTIDTDRRELHRAGGLICVEPQVFDLLEYLIRNRKRVVSKDELITAIWGGRIVSESALSTRTNAARCAIGDSGKEQRLIRTHRRKGIRFVGSVHEANEPEGAARTLSAEMAEPTRTSPKPKRRRPNGSLSWPKAAPQIERLASDKKEIKEIAARAIKAAVAAILTACGAGKLTRDESNMITEIVHRKVETARVKCKAIARIRFPPSRPAPLTPQPPTPPFPATRAG